jgi:hypothetical protein
MILLGFAIRDDKNSLLTWNFIDETQAEKRSFCAIFHASWGCDSN